jgi:hypothetical protein
LWALSITKHRQPHQNDPRKSSTGQQENRAVSPQPRPQAIPPMCSQSLTHWCQRQLTWSSCQGRGLVLQRAQAGWAGWGKARWTLEQVGGPATLAQKWKTPLDSQQQAWSGLAPTPPSYSLTLESWDCSASVTASPRRCDHWPGTPFTLTQPSGHSLAL